MNGRGEDVRDRIGVIVLEEVTSEGVEIKVSVCTGLEDPDEEGLPVLPSEAEKRSSAVPSVDGEEGFPVPKKQYLSTSSL